ncbi:MAG TPA: hypothetical protein VFU64_02610 [Gaiellaceae bacterium]|nr:hypothetical protein [Gaiellaceae bacterium]
MALTDDDQGGALVKKDGALAGTLVSAAVGVAAYRLRKAFAEGGSLSLPRREEDQRDESDHSHGGSALVTVWESASDSLLPLAEDAAEAAGRWVAEHSPAPIRDRLVPRFVEAFTQARR